jgi:PadR family transcriptional regulator PadR
MPGGQGRGGRGRGRSQGRGRGWRRPIRNFLEPCLLLVLRSGKSHGYDLRTELDPYGLAEINPSLVYRALRDMETQGLVESEWDTETTAGPARRVYSITEAGHSHLRQWAEDLRETDRILHHFFEMVDQTSEADEA